MRIDSSIFSPTDPTPVVAIYSFNYSGDTISIDTIRVRNFRDDSLKYHGQYKSSYDLLPLKISGSITDTLGLNYGRPDPGEDIKNCKVDFKVYWFGLVDVWFDKMIVDDARADELFKGVYDVKIEDELSIFKDSIIYFVGEITSSQAYTTKYVKDKMESYYPDAKMQFAVSNNLNIYSHRNPDTRAKLLFDIVQPEMMCLDAHVFQVDPNDIIYLPNNVSVNDIRVPQSWFKSPETYNQRLQTYALGNKDNIVTAYQGTFIYQITRIRNDLRTLSENTKFSVQPHLHSWTKTSGNQFQYFGFREPTNEEIQAQAVIAIAHGVQSLNWETYSSEYSENLNKFDSVQTQADPVFTILGLRNDSTTNFTKRESNIIYQNKWEYVKAMNLKILHWKPTLDKIKWDNGYSVHHENADHNFISDIKSIIVHSEAATSCYSDNTNYDCPEDRYWEMGFFDPDFTNPSVSGNDKSKYFIMVNRRCVPDENDDGDLRQLKIT